MKRLLIFSILLAAAGCAQSLTAPLDSVPITNIEEYFWSAGQTARYDSDLIATRDSGALLVADDSRPDGTGRTLFCRLTPDSITVERFGEGTIMDLGGYELVDSVNGQAHSGGHIVLLRANPLADSSWRAGTVMRVADYHTFPIEARLLARLDTLSINGASYSDVLAIRYAHEFPNRSADSTDLPYWVIFYARGRGPVMFDRVYYGPSSKTTFERRALLP